MKNNIAKITTNPHQLQSETGHWTRPKTLRGVRICNFCNTKKLKDEKHFHLDYTAYTEIQSHFQAIYSITDIDNMLPGQN